MANLPQALSDKSRDLAGKAVGVSGRSIERAAEVIRDGVPELAEAVESGKMKVSRAAKIAKLPHEEQAELLKSGGLRGASRTGSTHEVRYWRLLRGNALFLKGGGPAAPTK